LVTTSLAGYLVPAKHDQSPTDDAVLFVALWAQQPDEAVDRRIAIGIDESHFKSELRAQADEGFGSVLSIASVVVGDSQWLSAVCDNSSAAIPLKLNQDYAYLESPSIAVSDAALAPPQKSLRPTEWDVVSYKGQRQNAIAIEDVSRTALRSARLYASAGSGLIGSKPQTDDIRFTQQVSVKPNAWYHLSGWVKTENVAPEMGKSKGALLSIEDGVKVESVSITGIEDWTYVVRVFQVDEQSPITVAARLGFYGCTASGTAWFDDLSLVEIEPPEDPQDERYRSPDFLTAAMLENNLLTNAGFEELHTNPARCCVLGGAFAEFETQSSLAQSATNQLASCEQLAASGYRPVAVSCLEDQSPTAPTPHLQSVTFWRRPVIADSDKETLARRQANAAVAALRMDQPNKVWPLLQHSPDPTLRSFIIDRLRPLGAAPDALVKRLDEESDASIRQALLLILGDYPEDPRLDRAVLTTKLQDLYRSDPDAGVHAAAEWVLRKWGIDEPTLEGPAASDAGRHWYVTTTNQHTMAVIPGPVEFLMGSPSREEGRFSSEIQHRRRIDRSFAIAATEVTVRQFQRFLAAYPEVYHFYTERYAPEPDCPQTSVIWYGAAAYCRWLSEEEGLPEDQMCYPPVSEIKEGMRLPADCLSRSGYRLPTESEWEYACRGGSTTAFSFGAAEDLLDRYGWYLSNSRDRTWPVGSKKPNLLGLFDTHGNVYEWCQERYVSYSGSGAIAEDQPDKAAVANYGRRVLRGGSINNRATSVRSATRANHQPVDRNNTYGFRPARTYNLSPLPPYPLPAAGRSN